MFESTRMEPYVYIYIFEDGTTQQTGKPPSEQDLECVGAGILQIIHVASGHATDVLPDGSTEPLPSVSSDRVDGFTVPSTAEDD